jgi:hypothetical protein
MRRWRAERTPSSPPTNLLKRLMDEPYQRSEGQCYNLGSKYDFAFQDENHAGNKNCQEDPGSKQLFGPHAPSPFVKKWLNQGGCCQHTAPAQPNGHYISAGEERVRIILGTRTLAQTKEFLPAAKLAAIPRAISRQKKGSGVWPYVPLLPSQMIILYPTKCQGIFKVINAIS